MKFDYTHGKKARYVVSIHKWNTDDHYYFHYLNGAKEFFNWVRDTEREEGTAINLYDLDKDIRKEHVRI